MAESPKMPIVQQWQIYVSLVLRGELQKEGHILNLPRGEYLKTINTCLGRVLTRCSQEIEKTLGSPLEEAKNRILGEDCFVYKMLTFRREHLSVSPAEDLFKMVLETWTAPKDMADRYEDAVTALNATFYAKDPETGELSKELRPSNKKVTLAFISIEGWMHAWINTEPRVGEPSKNLYRMYCVFNDPSNINAENLFSLAEQLHNAGRSVDIKIPRELKLALMRGDAVVVYAPSEVELKKTYEIMKKFFSEKKVEVQYEFGKSLKGGTFNEALAQNLTESLADPTNIKKTTDAKRAFDGLIEEADRIGKFVKGEEEEWPFPELGPPPLCT